MPAGGPQNDPESPEAPEILWARLIDNIQGNDKAGLEEFSRVFSPGIRFYLARQLGRRAVDKRVRETVQAVVHAIQQGDVPKPERLVQFLYSIVRRQVAAQLELDASSATPAGTGASQHNRRRNQKAALKILRSVSPNDREILIRFYLQEQTPEQICREMDLTEEELRLLRSHSRTLFKSSSKR